MKILVRDINANFIEAVQKTICPILPFVDASLRDALADPAAAIVSPANSFGFMDGGIDMVYTRFFGWGLQKRVQDVIRSRPLQELLIGEAFSVPTDSAHIPNLIVAPTMRVPMRVPDPIAIMLATRAAVMEAVSAGYETIIIPGMGTGCGAVPTGVAASYMRDGIIKALVPTPFPETWLDAADQHYASAGFVRHGDVGATA